MESRYYRRFLKSIVLLLFITLSSCMKNTEEEVVIPSDFTGPVVIFYQQDFIKGTSNKHGHKLTIYVPDDGVVFTEFINQDGELITHFADNSKEKLIVGHHVGSIYIDKEVPYTVFYVGDNLELKNMKKLEYDDLKLIYENNLNK